MGKGLALPLLLAAKEVFKGATPSQKITPPGYLQMLLANAKPNIINSGMDDGSGYLRDVKVRYRNRVPSGKTVTTDDCSIQATPAYKDFTVDSTLFNKYAIFFEHDVIAKFERDALALQTLGTPATTIVKEVMEAIMEAANGMLADINASLLALQVAAFGKNVISASNAARTINFKLDATQNDLDAGMTRVMNDAMMNEIRMDGVVAVGSGLVNNYLLQQSAKANDQSGVNTSQLWIPKFYFDPYAQAGWGANQFGVFERNAVQFINICRFRGPKAGQLGPDEFGTVILPLMDSLGNPIGALEFDWQKRFITCPTEVVIGDAEEPTAVGRGVVLDLMCSYNQVNIAADAYDATDRLTGNNGTLRYVATNA
jgi:hypothetical protein